jgi:hypothetical protein
MRSDIYKEGEWIAKIKIGKKDYFLIQYSTQFIGREFVVIENSKANPTTYASSSEDHRATLISALKEVLLRLEEDEQEYVSKKLAEERYYGTEG